MLAFAYGLGSPSIEHQDYAGVGEDLVSYCALTDVVYENESEY